MGHIIPAVIFLSVVASTSDLFISCGIVLMAALFLTVEANRAQSAADGVAGP